MSAPGRRTVIAGAAAAAAAATTTVGTASAAHAAKAPVDLMRRSRFSQHLRSTFTMTSSSGRWSVVLASLDDLLAGGTVGSDTQFTASFTGAVPGDGVYTVTRKGFTATPLFVVAGRDSLVATVNRV
jgi:long-subunit fatty acid transport protein